MRRTWIAFACSVAMACGGADHASPVSPSTSVVPTPSSIATVTGVIGYDVLPPTYQHGTPQVGPTPFAGATVTVITPAGEGRATTTDASGSYTLQAPVGAFRLRYSARAYLTTESKETTVAAGDQLAMPLVRLKTAPWAVAGTVTDSRGTPVAGVTIGVSNGDPFGVTGGGLVTSDSAGHYRYLARISLISGADVVEPHWQTVAVSVSGTGVWNASQQVPCCDSPADTIHDIRVRHVIALTVHADPSTTLHVGGTAKFILDIAFDDSDITLITTCQTDNPAVLAWEIDSLGYQRMRAVAPGVATGNCGFLGLPAPIRMQVLP
jgi:Carboxypeptidase regulatory-like domain